jgi:glutamate-ammonia-ligase adenylyltransferase
LGVWLNADPDLGTDFAARGGRWFGADDLRAELAAIPIADETQLARALRRLRRRVWFAVALRDLCGAATLEEVTGAMSALADVSIEFALAQLHAWSCARYGHPRSAGGEEQRLVVVAMGKLGGGELNVSSDVDLIFLYAEDGQTDGPRPISNHEFFVRLGQRLIAALAQVTADGFVFRVDMRLRPNGDAGPLALSYDALEEYLVGHGREWERYAWIKARTVGAPMDAALRRCITPFVFRKYLDYGVFEAIRVLIRQIRAEVTRRDLAEHVKLGAGGIREIEFIAQVFQLLRGGREPALQQRSTLAVLHHLASARLLPEHAVAELDAAYRFLRALEHRLQYFDDQQTHQLPASDARRALLAEALGFSTNEDFETALRAHRTAVSERFERVFSVLAQESQGSAALPQEGRDWCELLQQHGFRAVTELAARVEALLHSAAFRRLSDSARGAIESLLPRVLPLAAVCARPDDTALRWLTLIEAIGGRAGYLLLLAQHAEAARRVNDLMAVSSWAATYLARHPILLDELLDQRLLNAEFSAAEVETGLRARIDASPADAERQMDILREAQHAQTFRLLLRDLAGQLTVERLSDHLSALADLLLEITLQQCWFQARKRHRDIPAFAVIAYGKLGGKELGYASDLDLVFLYDDSAPEAAENYARLAQRINTWLSSATPAGVMYQTDLRLRPDGAAGLLVSPFEAYVSYLTTKAWPWEHQALTRARFAAGDRDIGSRFEALRIDVLRMPRERGVVRDEVAAMRTKMHAAHPRPPAGEFDLKHDPGGLVDVEFIVQYVVLAYAAQHSALTRNAGNIALLGSAAELGLIDAALAVRAQDAYRTFRRMQHQLRLNGAERARVPLDAVPTSRDAVLELWRRVLG